MNKRNIKAKKDFYDLIEKEKDYEIKSEYKNSRQKIGILHKKCGTIYFVTPNNFKRGRRCPKCSHFSERHANSKRNFINLILKIDEYCLLSEYIGNKKKVKILHKKCGKIFEMTPGNFKNGSRCPQCRYKNIIEGHYIKFEDFIKKTNEYELKSKYVGDKDKVKIFHKRCNKTFYMQPNSFKQGHRCPICFAKGTSGVEKELQDWISEIITVEKNKRFHEDIKYKYEIDIFIPSKNIGIELDGIYWHSELASGKGKNYHLNKTKWFEKQGIRLIHIFDSEWNYKKDLIKSYIMSQLGISEKVIYARKCEIREITEVKEKNDFLNENHLQGQDKSNIRLGLFFNGELVSLMTFGKSRFNKSYEWELIRFCNKKNISVVGGFSRLMKYFIKNHGPKSIISYCDKRFFDGKIYELNGFSKTNDSKPNYFYTNDYVNLYSRIRFQKHKLPKKLKDFSPRLTEWDNMKNNGYDRIWDCGNKVFITSF